MGMPLKETSRAPVLQPSTSPSLLLLLPPPPPPSPAMLIRPQPSSPAVWKKPDPIVSDPSLSPTSPLERNPLSPKGWKNRDSGGIGLGIVTALGETPANIILNNATLHVAVPLAMASPRPARCSREETALACLGAGCRKPTKGRELSLSDTSPMSDGRRKIPATEFRTADFLSRCNLCRKRLHGKDIYMYRGEKAFCSMECRYQQIVNDEMQEKCGSRVSKPSSSPCSGGGGRLFFTGIVAA